MSILGYESSHFYEEWRKQQEAIKTEVFNKSNEQHRKDLVELAYYLPFGIGADYFYTFMVLMLNSKCEGVADMLPAKQRKAFYETVKQSEERKESEVK